MNLSIGIIGLPNVGKSTLFNALLRKQAAASANFPFTTIEPNVGVVPVPDERLEKLAKVVGTQTVIPATVKFVDIAGLVKGASEGEGLGNKFLSHIREVDATVHLVRDFQDSEVVRVGESPEKDIEIVNTELQLADLETIGKLLDEAERQTKASRDPQTINKLNALEKIKESLEKGLLASEASLTEVEKEAVGVLPLLTVKPQVITLNVDEDKLAGEGLRISAKLESELAELTEEEAREYLSELGVEESGLEKLVRKMYQTLGLISFFTAGEKEARAWTVKAGTKAPQAAGVIHTDFEKGFIKADVVTWEKLVEASGWAEARAKGLVRLEGREYAVADGDVCLFRFQ
jgi:ribosome-binding ATPase YchF (GTP1/OBG family)